MSEQHGPKNVPNIPKHVCVMEHCFA